jgi:hypothetical protein
VKEIIVLHRTMRLSLPSLSRGYRLPSDHASDTIKERIGRNRVTVHSLTMESKGHWTLMKASDTKPSGAFDVNWTVCLGK